MSPSATAGAAPTRVLLLVTTRKDAEISQRLFRVEGIEGVECNTLADVANNLPDASALLTTEEGIQPDHFEELLELLSPDDSLHLPVVLLTRGGTESRVANLLLARLENLTILERPAPLSSIISAVKSAVRVRSRQRELRDQLGRIQDLQNQLSIALSASELGTFHCRFPLDKIVWNDQCKAHFWLPPEAEIDFDLFYSIVHPDDRAATRAAIEACVNGHQKYAIEYRTVSPRGEVRWVRATGQTQRGADGQPTVFSGTTIDITVRKSLELERDQLLSSERAARIAGEKANQLKDEFLATLSHELRTPLNAIVGWVEIMKIEADNVETVREGLQVVERNVRAQGQLIDDLLDVSRIISGKVRLEIKAVDLGNVVRAAMDTVRPTAQARGVRLESAVPSQSAAISGDFNRLQQVVWNLITNAVKFTPKGGKVQVLLEQVNSSLLVSVSDTGEGIEADFLPHVFERFRQADGTPSRRHGGLGLGLSIVKTLVEMHGGKVSARSAGRGQGSTFCLEIPIRLVQAQEREPSPSAGAETSRAPWAELPDLSGITVLVLDDEADARAMMRRLISSARAKSVEAASAAEAQRIIAAGAPDIILSDIGMPEVDGYQFIRQLRKANVGIPAVALTAFARPEDRVRAIQSGFQAHLAKPLDPAELLVLVASLCGRIPRAG